MLWSHSKFKDCGITSIYIKPVMWHTADFKNKSAWNSKSINVYYSIYNLSDMEKISWPYYVSLYVGLTISLVQN